ncbi:hypothetical protein BH23GEM11_BH23GEM11_05700 [soil metagenome]
MTGAATTGAPAGPSTGYLPRILRILEERPAAGLGIFAIFYGVGVAGHLAEATRPLMLAITPWFLLLMGLLALATLLRAGGRAGGARFWTWAGATFVATWALEVLGVHTGIVFGEYVYGRGLGAPVLGVPPLIGFNWVLVCLGVLIWVAPAGERRGVPKPVLALVAALLATGFDWVMEPVAMELGYWSWAGGVIPVQNYVAWFGIALGASLGWLYGLPKAARTATRLPAWHVVVQLLFFAALRVGLVGG